jgi:hypothetical protein
VTRKDKRLVYLGGCYKYEGKERGERGSKRKLVRCENKEKQNAQKAALKGNPSISAVRAQLRHGKGLAGKRA